MSRFITKRFRDFVKNHQCLVHTSILSLIITTVGKVSSQFQQLQQPGGVQIFVPSQYGGSQPSMFTGYPTNPYSTGNAPAWSNNYSPIMSQFSPGSVGIGSYPMMQPQFAPPGLQSSFLSAVPQGYTYSPLLSSSSQFSSPQQGYPYPAVMGTGNLFDSSNIPQAVQVMSGVPQMTGFGTASLSPGRTVRILVPVYAPRPPSSSQSATTNPTPDPSQPQASNPNPSSDPSQMAATNPASSVPPTSLTTNPNSSSDPSQVAATNPASSVPPTPQTTNPNTSSDPFQVAATNPALSVPPTPQTINPTPLHTSNPSDPNTHSATSQSPTSSSSNADNTSLSKINELIQAAANESDPDETKLLGNIMDIVKEAFDVEKLRRKQSAMVSSHDGSSDSTSAITKSVNMLINKLVQDALTAQ